MHEGNPYPIKGWKTSRVRFNPPIPRSSGRVGTCRYRSGFATTFFLPLAMLRREVWWRNLALVISMVLFGLWHRASVLFLVWGCYPGVLLVLHRQVQQAQRKFDWEPPAAVWTLLSWIATMALINLGWIFFRANSLPRAHPMLSVVVSPASYHSHFLSGSLYLLVTALALGYAIALLTIDALEGPPADAQLTEGHANPGIIGLMARWRWFWIPPLYALAWLFLLIVTLTRGASTAQFMYDKF